MEFKILSHAGLLVTANSGKTLICDPWLIGSSYWRSWWNYPPVSKSLVDSLKPDFIYLTHIHWDHFHGPSLKKFSPDTCIIVPKGNYSRMREDLNYLGFQNIIELRHGETMKLDDDFYITSYQVWMFVDSALLIDCNGARLLNLNDSKHMGPTLKQIIKKHQPIDFVFRSHSSANERLSYSVVDDPDAIVDDITTYIQDFTNTVRATGAKYAVPFASNHCHLHKDSIHFNKHVQHPKLVKQYFEDHDIDYPQLKIMVSGDSWNSGTGFELTDKKWFDNREHYLDIYLKENCTTLNAFYSEEDSVEVDPALVQEYFRKLSKAMPFFARFYFRKKKFTYVLKKAEVPAYIFNVDLNTGRVETVELTTDLNHDEYPLQIHTTAYIFLRSIEFRIFSHMCIGKRVFYKVTKAEKKYMEALNMIFNFYEYDMLPLYRNLGFRSLESWTMRWRELLLYAFFVRDLVFDKSIDTAKYLPSKYGKKGPGDLFVWPRNERQAQSKKV
ncbi:MAG: MBL fold metallo-hydrolase [Sphingobacteriales bacterium]|nr:MAG: MBL fold metallo-hydrolase [Sphingobacteriales bacterium]